MVQWILSVHSTHSVSLIHKAINPLYQRALTNNHIAIYTLHRHVCTVKTVFNLSSVSSASNVSSVSIASSVNSFSSVSGLSSVSSLKNVTSVCSVSFAYMFPSFLRTDLGTNLSSNLGIPQICPQIWGHIRPQIWGFPKFVPKF